MAKKGPFTQYAERFGADLGVLFNRHIAATLKEGVKVAVKATTHDSSLSAYHWMLIPKGGQHRPGGRREARFQYLYGQAPVGEPGDKGSHKARVRNYVLSREIDRVISKAVQGRRPVTHFAFFNAIPGESGNLDSHHSSSATWGRRKSSYRENAGIEGAMQQAHEAMNRKFRRLVMRSNSRKIPLGQGTSGPDPFPTRF